jgi:hypothetical protein
LGKEIPTGQPHRFTWDVSKDWAKDFSEVQFEIIAKDGRDLLNLDFIQIPATGNQTALKISRTPLNDNDFLSVWYWLIATRNPDIRFSDGKITRADGVTAQVPGLLAEYFESNSFSGNKVFRVDQTPSHQNYYWEGIPFTPLSIRWSGDFVPTKTGGYSFSVYADGQGKVSFNGQTRFDSSGGESFTVNATAGIPIPLLVEIKPYSWSLNSSPSIYINNITPPGENRRGVMASDFQTTTDEMAEGTSTTRLGREFLFSKMGLREATAAEVLRAKEAGNPGVIEQWEPKLRVGPDERPVKVNAYGFETGADGYWVVPVSGN